jgi:hypothetical protein
MVKPVLSSLLLAQVLATQYLDTQLSFYCLTSAKQPSEAPQIKLGDLSSALSALLVQPGDLLPTRSTYCCRIPPTATHECAAAALGSSGAAAASGLLHVPFQQRSRGHSEVVRVNIRPDHQRSGKQAGGCYCNVKVGMRCIRCAAAAAAFAVALCPCLSPST